MSLREEFEKSGNWLFQGRSYFPLLVGILFLIALRHFTYPYHNHVLDEIWGFFCLGISFLGLGIRALTIGFTPKGTSGRTTQKPAATTLNTSGMYSIVRHPLYLGNFFIWVGILLSTRFWWFTLVAVLLFWLYYERIMFAEEEFLRKKFGEVYLEWAAKTPAFLPRLKNWQRPRLPFSFKTVLRKEYSGFFGVIALFTVLELIEDWIVEKKLVWDPIWTVLFILGFVVFVVLRTLKKKTRLLNVEGR